MSFMDVIRCIIRSGAQSVMTEEDFIEVETAAWLASEKRRQMMIGQAYARGEHDVLQKTRSAIGDGGKKTTVRNLPNNIIIDNQYGKLVNQKASYLLAKPFEVKTENEAFGAQLKPVFNQVFRRTLKQIGEDCLNAGVGYLYPYFADNELRFRRFAPEEILPFWADDAHEELISFLRVYTLEYYEGRTKKQSIKVQYFSKEGVRYFAFDSGKLLPDVEAEDSPYLQVGGVPMNWDRVPLIVFRANSAERPLISRVKSLQDALNTLLSTFADNLQEDARSTILVIHNYDGEELGGFRKNLSTFGAVKVRDTDSGKGGVETLSIEVNAQNYELVLRLLKRAIIENGCGFDAKDDRLSNNPNQMNIQSMYSDIDLDANDMELEFQAALERLMWFVGVALRLKKVEPETVEFVFNRDILINEAEAIEDCRNSEGVISRETIVANHPWTKDTKAELERLKKERADEAEEMRGTYPVGEEHGAR